MPEPEVQGVAPASPSSAAPTSSEMSESAANESDAQPTQATEPQTTTQTTPDPWESLKDHPEVIRRIEEAAQQRADQLAQKRMAADRRAQRRETARNAVQNEDADSALALARQVAAEPDEDETHSAEWTQKADRVAPVLERILRVDTTGQVTNPLYVQVYQKVGKAEMDRRYAADPEAFIDFVEDEIAELRLDARLKKAAPGLYQAGVTDAQNRALQSMAVPPNGQAGSAGASDDEFITQYAEGRSDDHARWQKIAARLK